MRSGIALALALALAPSALAADGDFPPRQLLETGPHVSRDYAVQGMWWAQPYCGPIAIDAAPGRPRALKVAPGRRRIRIVYRTTHRPAFVAVEVYGSRVSQHARRERLRPRREDGEVVAWVVSFKAKVRGELRVFPFVGWDDHRGCGQEFVESAYRLRSR